MATLEMTCDRCPVSPKCPKSGASPLMLGGKRYHCRIVGGFGRKPVDPEILSQESLAAMKAGGACLTIAEVPLFVDGMVAFEVVKVFSDPVLSEREKPSVGMDHLVPKSFR